MISVAVLLTTLVVSSHAWWGGPKVEPDWDKLSVTFLKFNQLPMSEHEAIESKWTKTADGCKDGLHFKGSRYVLNGDMATMLLFDKNGHSAGIQMAVNDNFQVTRTGKYAKEGNKYVLTAYFTDPSMICVDGRKVNKGYLGDKLFLEMKNGPVSIPLDEEDIKDTKWTKGRCFYGMGQHYWYNVRKDMDCNDFAPFFLLYNGGKLNGFGFAGFGNLQNTDRVEHPPQSAIRFFFQEKPVCIEKQPHLTTQHIYLQRRPQLNFC